VARGSDDSGDVDHLETRIGRRFKPDEIGAVVAAARDAGAKTAIDGTFATPALQRPFEFGVDFVMHALTKFMGGHSDVMGGALIVRDDEAALEALFQRRVLTGGVLAPFDAWLTARGLQSLHCRMAQHSKNAAAIAEWLHHNPAVERVNYPFLPSSHGYDIARKQMASGGGILSFELTGGKEAALAVAGALKIFVNATSVGGVESLVEHRESVERGFSDTPENLLRLSVGLEHIDDLIEDLDQAFSAI
ncbi:MAG: PLP-dependent aspartate aminotransferase family protein, partial [Pseudomonadota bacterium]